MKLLCVKKCIMHTGESHITVGKVYSAVTTTDSEILIRNDNNCHHFFESDLTIEGYFVELTSDNLNELTAQLLIPASRQYIHNDNSGFVAGYDVEETRKIVKNLLESLVC